MDLGLDLDSEGCAKKKNSEIFLVASAHQILHHSKSKSGGSSVCLQIKDHDDGENESVLRNFRSILVLGRVLGLVPIHAQLLLRDNVEDLRFWKGSWPSLSNCIVCICLSVNCAVTFVGIVKSSRVKTLGDYAWSPAEFLVFFYGLYMYFFGRNRVGQLISVLKRLQKLELQFTKIDVNLPGDFGKVSTLAIIITVLEHLTFHLKTLLGGSSSEELKPRGLLASKNDTNLSRNPLQVYYGRAYNDWTALAPYSPWLLCYLFLMEFLSVCAWSYGDLLIISFSRVLHFKIKHIYTQATARLCHSHIHGDEFLEQNSENGGTIPNGDKMQDNWQQLTSDYYNIFALLDEISHFLSPIIFISYAMNIYFFCLQMNLGFLMARETAPLSRFYVALAIFWWTSRLYLVSTTGAKVNEWAVKSLELCQKCPDSHYSKRVARLEKYVSGSRHLLGLSGLNCFIITKPLILQILGVIFTFEIILLQASVINLTPL